MNRTPVFHDNEYFKNVQKRFFMFIDYHSPGTDALQASVLHLSLPELEALKSTEKDLTFKQTVILSEFFQTPFHDNERGIFEIYYTKDGVKTVLGTVCHELYFQNNPSGLETDLEELVRALLKKIDKKDLSTVVVRDDFGKYYMKDCPLEFKRIDN